MHVAEQDKFKNCMRPKWAKHKTTRVPSRHRRRAAVKKRCGRHFLRAIPQAQNPPLSASWAKFACGALICDCRVLKLHALLFQCANISSVNSAGSMRSERRAQVTCSAGPQNWIYKWSIVSDGALRHAVCQHSGVPLALSLGSLITQSKHRRRMSHSHNERACLIGLLHMSGARRGGGGSRYPLWRRSRRQQMISPRAAEVNQLAADVEGRCAFAVSPPDCMAPCRLHRVSPPIRATGVEKWAWSAIVNAILAWNSLNWVNFSHSTIEEVSSP